MDMRLSTRVHHLHGNDSSAGNNFTTEAGHKINKRGGGGGGGGRGGGGLRGRLRRRVSNLVFYALSMSVNWEKMQFEINFKVETDFKKKKNQQKRHTDTHRKHTRGIHQTLKKIKHSILAVQPTTCATYQHATPTHFEKALTESVELGFH